jgi:DNA polymerase I - 3''-5'' exonuclease and polymerase domains
LEDPSIKKIGQNIKFDFIVFYHRGIQLESLEDTMLMSYTLDGGKNRHNMDTLASIHLGHQTIKFKDLVGTGKKQINFSEVNIDDAKNYAAQDADVTLRLYQIFSKNLKLEKMTSIYENFEKPLIQILALMEINGIKLNESSLKNLSSKLGKKLTLLEQKIFEIFIKKKFQ